MLKLPDKISLTFKVKPSSPKLEKKLSSSVKSISSSILLISSVNSSAFTSLGGAKTKKQQNKITTTATSLLRVLKRNIELVVPYIK